MTLSINHRLIIAFLIFGLAPFAVIGSVLLYESSKEIEKQAFQKLTAVAENKKNSIERYFNTIRDQVTTLAKSTMIIDAMRDFGGTFKTFREENAVTPANITPMKSELTKYYKDQFAVEFAKQNNGANADVDKLYSALDDDSIALQYYYIQANQNPIGKKDKLDKANDQSVYSKFHAKYHPAIRDFLEKFDYRDIFLVDPKTGDIIYSVFKEPDFTTSLLDGPYSETNFGEAFRKALQLEQGEFAFIDFKQYLPSFNAPASFIATPIFDGGMMTGVLIFQMPLDRITQVMSERAGLGKTGESYLVGSDSLMRSDAYLDKKNRSVAASFRNPEIGKVDTDATKAAIAGGTGTAVITNYLGNPVLSSYTPVDILGLKWALLAESNTAEAFEAKRQMVHLILLVGLAGLAGIGVLGYFYARSFSRPITGMTDAMRHLAGGNIEVEVPAIGRKDEIGEMASALQIFRENALAKTAMAEEHSKNEERLCKQKEEATKEVRDFMGRIGQIVETVTTAVAQVNASSKSMADIAIETKNRTKAATAGSNDASQNVQTVATAAEQLSGSINEISRQVSTSAEIAGRAVQNAKQTDDQIQSLVQIASNIGEVVNLIADIAKQTNLLALNATIESARAGEAGKGFAVVASEVKDLASQTAKATEQISAQISDIQNATKDAVSAIGSISGIISEMDHITSGISAAVEEQTAATQEIARAIDRAASGTEQAVHNIQAVDEAADTTGNSATRMMGASDELHRQAEMMKIEVDKFMQALVTGPLDRRNVNMPINFSDRRNVA